GFRRVLGVFPWLFIAAFIAASNRVDRYILIAMPWLCAAVGVFVVDASSTAPLARFKIPVAAIAVALSIFGLWQQARPVVFVEPAHDDRGVLQRWLLRNAPAGSTVWIEADVLPLLQATFADPGGDLQACVQEAFRNAYPGFDVRFLKGERIERTANYDPALIT